MIFETEMVLDACALEIEEIKSHPQGGFALEHPNIMDVRKLYWLAKSYINLDKSEVDLSWEAAKLIASALCNISEMDKKTRGDAP